MEDRSVRSGDLGMRWDHRYRLRNKGPDKPSISYHLLKHLPIVSWVENQGHLAGKGLLIRTKSKMNVLAQTFRRKILSFYIVKCGIRDVNQ